MRAVQCPECKEMCMSAYEWHGHHALACRSCNALREYDDVLKRGTVWPDRYAFMSEMVLSMNDGRYQS